MSRKGGTNWRAWHASADGSLSLTAGHLLAGAVQHHKTAQAFLGGELAHLGRSRARVPPFDFFSCGGRLNSFTFWGFVPTRLE
jgi:hypothetical protein